MTLILGYLIYKTLWGLISAIYVCIVAITPQLNYIVLQVAGQPLTIYSHTVHSSYAGCMQ